MIYVRAISSKASRDPPQCITCFFTICFYECGEIFVTLLLSTATPDKHRAVIQDCMGHDLTEARQRVSTPSRTFDAIRLKPKHTTAIGLIVFLLIADFAR